MPADFATLQEMVQLARSALARGEWDYLTGAAETETTMKRNRLALDRLALRARVMNDVSQVHTRRSLLGVDLRIPVLLAPIGSLQVFEAGGGLSAARAPASSASCRSSARCASPSFETPGPAVRRAQDPPALCAW
jgi:glycolate oxidase